MDAEPPKWLKILCFGDSLTAGYTMWGTEHYPYADILHVHLKRLLPSTNIVIDVAGLSGDQVVPPRGNFINRMESRIKKAAGAAVPYDWVIVLGGTNDLGWSREPEDIYHALSKLSS
jgi:lysophospholipase L1-like esterase